MEEELRAAMDTAKKISPQEYAEAAWQRAKFLMQQKKDKIHDIIDLLRIATEKSATHNDNAHHWLGHQVRSCAVSGSATVGPLLLRPSALDSGIFHCRTSYQMN